jgi:hypothetical protein
VSPRRACSGLSRLADGLVCHAARVDDGDIGAEVVGALYMTIAEEPLAHVLRIGMRHLATEETNGERRHLPDATAPKTAFHDLS